MVDESKIVGKPMFKCQRCGTYYERYNGLDVGIDNKLYNSLVFLHVNERTPRYSKIMTLCPYCMVDFIDWWKDIPIEE